MKVNIVTFYWGSYHGHLEYRPFHGGFFFSDKRLQTRTQSLFMGWEKIGYESETSVTFHDLVV